jgi:hypothetical protein
MSTRRYDEAEAQEIFRLATSPSSGDQLLPRSVDGLSLAELQEIGASAGIDPAHVAGAAARLDGRAIAGPVQRSLGLPISVERVVALPRAVTDSDWGRLVSECRSTFGAHGRIETSGRLRDWSHGGLHVSIEPTADGELLRLRELSARAEALGFVSVVAGSMGVLFSGAIALTGQPAKALVFASVFGSVALVAYVTNRLRLPRWARDRERQLDAIAERAVRLLAAPVVAP